MMRKCVISILLVLMSVSAMPAGPAQLAVRNQSKTIDPCSVATADQLRTLLKSALASAFPIEYSRPGKKITLRDPQLLEVKCDNPLKIEVRADIRVRDTRGLDQGSASGKVRFTARIRGKVTYASPIPGPVTRDNFKSAMACMGEVNIKELNLNNVPNWVDNTVIKDMINAQLPKAPYCIDITPYVTLFLQSGGTL